MGRCVHWWLGFHPHHDYYLSRIAVLFYLSHSGLVIITQTCWTMIPVLGYLLIRSPDQL
jgi:hypothetical protein